MRRLSCAIAVLLFVLLGSAAQPSEPYTGSWNIGPSNSPGRIWVQLQYSRSDAAGTDESEHSTDMPLVQLRGLTAPAERQQFRLAMGGFKLATLDLLLQNGFERPSVDDLVAMMDHGVGNAYVSAMKSVTFSPKTAGALIELRDHGVSATYVAGLQRLGFHPSVDDLVRLADHGVSIAFIARLRSHGYAHLSAEDLIRLRDSGF